MMKILETLEKYITTVPDTIQFAIDRKYEEAWIIPRSDKRPTSKEINNYLPDQYEHLIVEYMWNSDKADKVFILTVFNDNTNDLVTKGEFVSSALDLFYTYKDFRSFVEQYDQEIIGTPYLFRQPIEDINIGVFNHWLSVGPVLVQIFLQPN